MRFYEYAGTRLVVVLGNGFWISVCPRRRWYRFAVCFVPFAVLLERSP